MMRIVLARMISLGWFCGLLLSVQAQPDISLQLFASGFSMPVDIAHAGDARLFVVEKAGKIRIVDAEGQVNPVPFLDITDRVRSSGSEQGLLGLAFHPDYASNGWFFVNYITDDKHTHLSRFQVRQDNPDAADPESEEVLLRISQPYDNHNGGDLAFGPDGYLYMSLGDGGSGGDPINGGQRTDILLGKMLRLDVDQLPYVIPGDNPFVGNAQVRDEIWALGLRNPWRFSFDRSTGDMWIADVGQARFEEVNFVPAGNPGGQNYGWRCYEGNESYNLQGCDNLQDVLWPVFTYNNSPAVGRSVTGGFVYRGSTYPFLQGHYVMGDYVTGRFWTIFRDEEGEVSVTDHGKLMNNGQCSTFGEDVNGELYVAALREGNIFRVQEANAVSIASESGRQQLRVFPNPVQAQLTLEFAEPLLGSYRLELIDVNGKVVYRQEDIRSQRVEVSRGNLAAGMYLFRLTGPEVLSGKLLFE